MDDLNVDPTFPSDPADAAWGSPLWPASIKGFRDHQKVAIPEILGHFLDGVDVVLCEAPTGCLAGDTTVGVNRGGKSGKFTMERLVHCFNGGKPKRGPSWDQSIPTHVQRVNDGVVVLGEVAAAYESGVKMTYTLRTFNGREIRATETHPFLTANGWKPLGDIRPHDVVMVNGGRSAADHRPKNWYQLVSGLQNHPFHGRRGVKPGKGGFSVPQHRLVVEADINNLTYPAFIERIKSGEVEGLTFLDPAEFQVHHVDEDPHNNALTNLRVMTEAQHHAHHAKDHGRHVLEQVGVDVVRSIEFYGQEMTYDLTMVDSPHSFIANEFVVHNSGKTVIGEATRRLLSVPRCLYVANTKGLQDQFMGEFGSYARCLKGRSNYPTLDHPEKFNDRFLPVTAGDCNKSKVDLPACGDCDRVSDKPVLHCSQCHPWAMCPYEVAKREAFRAPLAVTNTAYFITEANGPGMFTEIPFVIVDECDTLESILKSQIEVHIPERRRREFGMDPPKRKTVEEAWLPWVTEEARPKVGAAIDRWNAGLIDYDAKGNPRQRMPTIAEIREGNYLSRLAGKLARLEVELGEGNAVYDGYEKGDVRFKPIRVASSAADTLWRHGKQWLLMSATIIDPYEQVQTLGIEEAGLTWAVVKVPSTFPPENRPIHVKPIAEMKYSERETAWPKMVDGIKKVLAKHPNDRTLIHTVSYSLTQFIFDGIRSTGRPIFLYSEAKEREKALEGYIKTPGAVLLAPSMDRGVDLPGDLCRVQIIPKIPFLNTSDKMVNKRLYSSGGQLWYQVQTVRSLVQMTGRGVRSAEDKCDTYILDKQFLSNVHKNSRALLPEWWTESIDWTGGGIQ